MAFEKTSGIIFIILGLIFIIFPMFSTGLVSIIVGLSLLFFGISAAIMGFNMRNAFRIFSLISIIIGIIAIILGILFIFYINAVAFLVAFEFYIVGFIMVIFGITGLLAQANRISKFTSILVLLMGVVAIALGAFAGDNPIYVAIVIGIVLLVEGIAYILDDD